MTKAQVINPLENYLIRYEVRKEDAAQIRALVQNTGVFSAEEVDIAEELVLECLEQGEEKSGYSFIFAEQGGQVKGYSCYGRIPFTHSAYDLYWIAVDNDQRKSGLAGHILELTEKEAAQKGCTQLYAETSGTDYYIPARKFYLKTGFFEAARFKDFYKPGDDKFVFRKDLN